MPREPLDERADRRAVLQASALLAGSAALAGSTTEAGAGATGEGAAGGGGEVPPARGAQFDAHLRAEFVDRDVDETMATMIERPHVNHVPVMTGGQGREEVRRFYADHFVGRWPADMRTRLVSRTVGQGRVVDELVASFTHDLEIPAILPGVPPTGRPVELPIVIVVGTEGGKVAYEHIYWDQASLLVQVGLLDPAGLPVTGAEQARKLLDPSLPGNALLSGGKEGAPPSAR